MKILLSAYACEPNKGSEPGVGWNWATSLSEHHEVWVITRKNNQKAIEEELTNLNIQNINFVYYDVPKWLSFWKKGQKGVHLYYILWQLGILKIANELDKRHNFDLIHHITFNEFRTPGFLYFINKPFIWGPIGGGQNYNPKFKKIYGNYKVILKERLRNCVNSLSLYNPFFLFALKKSKLVLIADPTTERIMPAKYREKYYRMLETGVNIEKTFLTDDYNEDEKITLFWAGNIIPRKGLPLLLKAVSKLNENINYEVIIVGDGSDRNRCEKLAGELNLKKITFFGKLNHNELQKKYNEADVFVFTSLRDTSGNVVLEAMRKGLPIITLDHHGVSEIVTDECGIKIEVTDIEDVTEKMKEAIEYMYNNKELVQFLGRNAMKRIEDKYDWKRKSTELTNLYSDILEV